MHIDEPTLQMTFGTNTSPLAGKDGKFLTARQIEERLNKEIQKDVSLKVRRIPNSETWVVSGRGELHLGVLIENMRREGFELEVSKPEVIIIANLNDKEKPYKVFDVKEEINKNSAYYLEGGLEFLEQRYNKIIKEQKG